MNKKQSIRFVMSLSVILSFICTLASCIRSSEEPKGKADAELDHLIILEVSYNGSYRAKYLDPPTNKKEFPSRDDWDKYIKIHNPTKETKYLDGLGLAISVFSSTGIYIFKNGEKDDFRPQNFGASHIIHFPGSGKDYPIKPGQTVLIAQTALDHTKDYYYEEFEETINGNPNSLDLTNADFEWLTPEQIKKEDAPYAYRDNPKVPNMIGIYPSSTLRDHNHSGIEQSVKGGPFDIEYNTTIALVEIKKEDYTGEKLTEKIKSFDLTFVTTNPWDTTWEAVMIPNQNVIDAVVIAPRNEDNFHPVAPTLDKGSYGVSLHYIKDPKKDKENMSKAIRRKSDGIRWVDQNNSTTDFEVVKISADKEIKPVKTPQDK